ncbi:MAG: carboxylate--amine ligase, partial [Nitrospinota bacterium]
MTTPVRRCALLLYTTTGYEAEAYLKAARKLDLEIVVGTDRCHRLEDPWRDGAIPLRFEDPAASVRSIVAEAKKGPIGAVVPIGD